MSALGAAEVGEGFVEAIAAKDHRRVAELVADDVDFRAITPNRFWEVSSAEALISEVLRNWFEDTDHIDELVELESDSFADREHLAYSFRGHNDDGPFVVEQHAYYTVEDGRIAWMRVLCSGFRPPGD
jgi:ketosteroid isomerase-like protein